MIWAAAGPGKAMPVDPEPVEGGNLELVAGGSQLVPRVRVVPAGERAGRVLHTSHFVTCPHAGRWRRR